MQNDTSKIFINVILPIKFKEDIFYTVSKELAANLHIGDKVEVLFARKRYICVIKEITNTPHVHNEENEIDKEQNKHVKAGEDAAGRRATDSDNSNTRRKEIEYKDIIGISSLQPIYPQQIELWKQIADYYMCTIGEVYKAAYPINIQRQEIVKSRISVSKEDNIIKYPELSAVQQNAIDEIKKTFSAHSQTGKNKPVLLHGVTGSGKTEIYITLAKECLRQGKNVLFMVPEIALSKQLNTRLKKYFGQQLLVFHSKQTIAQKGLIHKLISTPPTANEPDSENNSHIILGTRSSLFLPYNNLGLIIVDEEHDISYKQTEPAPRYNGRDAAIMLAGIYGADMLLGSATPSFESLYNCTSGRFAKVDLKEKYFGSTFPDIEIINTIYARKTRQMKGNFSQKLINELKKNLSEGGQSLIFRNRRSYAPIIECSECGYIPKCPHCNVYMSYHKYNNTIRCHYCDYITLFTGRCPECGCTTFNYKGSGTEKIEEELAALIPEARIARFDADIAKSKREEERVLKEFSKGEIDILVGTQMLSKGFDFENLKLVGVLQADSILGIQDFRADERAIQLFSQLMGRAGRRKERGKLIIQTSQKEHPVFELLKKQSNDIQSNEILGNLMSERKEFQFTPYIRMVKIIVKHADADKLNQICGRLESALNNAGKSLRTSERSIADNKNPFIEVTGPFVPVIDKIRGEWLKCFYIKFAKDKHLAQNKQRLLQIIERQKLPDNIIIDVDPI